LEDELILSRAFVVARLGAFPHSCILISRAPWCSNRAGAFPVS
jgi:hypothetical protein